LHEVFVGEGENNVVLFVQGAVLWTAQWHGLRRPLRTRQDYSRKLYVLLPFAARAQQLACARSTRYSHEFRDFFSRCRVLYAMHAQSCMLRKAKPYGVRAAPKTPAIRARGVCAMNALNVLQGREIKFKRKDLVDAPAAPGTF
jgi:hypothetical protein